MYYDVNWFLGVVILRPLRPFTELCQVKKTITWQFDKKETKF
ncbi:MAG: hypothetical protein RJA07_1488 [Bacteroidota bacterium]|jgi:hypothetical protein